MRRSLSLTLALSLAALLTAPADAQSVTFRGKVEDVSGTQNQFVVDCTTTSLTSTAFNLNLFVGQQVEITGDWNGSVGSPSVNVQAIAVVPEVFELGGGAKIGEELKVGDVVAVLIDPAAENPAEGRVELVSRANGRFFARCDQKMVTRGEGIAKVAGTEPLAHREEGKLLEA